MKTKKFNELFYFAPKSNISAREGQEYGEYPFYTSSIKLTKKINKALYKGDSLIFGTGGKASIHYTNKDFSTSTDCLVAIPIQEILNIKYIYYYFLGNMHILEKGFHGAGLKHISKKYIENIDIPIYSIEVQNKIVKVLDKIYNLLKKREESIELINELIRAYFLDIFGDPITNKFNWTKDLFTNMAHLERGRFSPRPRNDPTYFEGRYPFIQTGDINKSEYRLKSYTQTLNKKGTEVSKEFKAGTVLIAIVGATIGATTILMIDAYTTDSVIGIKVNKKKLDNVFLEMLLRFYRKPLLDKAPNGARANINLNILNQLELIQPPLALQKKFRNFSDNIENQKNHLNQSLMEINNLFNSTIKRIFDGKLNLNVSVEVDAFLKEIDLDKEKNDLTILTKDIAYLQNFVDRINEQDFENQELYNQAKHTAFQLLKEKKYIKQEYNDLSQSIKVVLI